MGKRVGSSLPYVASEENLWADSTNTPDKDYYNLHPDPQAHLPLLQIRRLRQCGVVGFFDGFAGNFIRPSDLGFWGGRGYPESRALGFFRVCVFGDDVQRSLPKKSVPLGFRRNVVAISIPW